ncbi:invasion associated locus B family protein [Roseovarius sp. C7]|uniref:invasion associated locus B family protein n=1 Tax=Roseovarius sp. C7 TaxID=3398643 RepID=UPI0039F5FB8A
MLKTLSMTTLSALLIGTAPVFAQETATDDTAATEAQSAETTAETATETTADTETADQAEAVTEGEGQPSNLDMGREVQEEPTYVKETIGDWEMRCFRSEAEEDPCQMFQLLKEQQGNPIAEFAIFRLQDSGPAVAGATVTVPLFTLLTAELKIGVDGGKPKSYPFRFCSQTGCTAQIGLTQADVDAFKRGAKAVVTITPAQAPDQKVAIDASLSGFTKAFDAVSVIQN